LLYDVSNPAFKPMSNNQLSSIPKTAFNKAPIGPVAHNASSVAVLNQTAKGMIAM